MRKKKIRNPQLRTLHLVDVENLVGLDPSSSHRSMRDVPNEAFTAALTTYRRRYLRPNDCAWAAVDKSRTLALAPFWSKGALLAGSGTHGAENALIAMGETMSPHRFDVLFIASGDHAFTEFAERYKGAGGHVVVLANRYAISAPLYCAADEFIANPLDDKPTLAAA